MAGEPKITTDHEVIKKWAEERGGKPAVVANTEGTGPGAGLLRINFPSYGEKKLKEISWDNFFKTFEQQKLAFLYQDQVRSGEQSRFFKFIRRKESND